jgi:hypothetical protein
MSQSIVERIASRSAPEKKLLELRKDEVSLISFVRSLEQVHLDGEGLVDSDISGLEVLGPSLSHLFLNRSIMHEKSVFQ